MSSITTGNWSTIKSFITKAKDSGVTVEVKKSWVKMTSANKVKVYVQSPNKGGTSRYVDVNGHGYDGTLAGESLMDHPAVNLDTENGGVAFRIDLTADGGQALFERVIELLPTLEAQAKPRAPRGAKAAGPAIDVKAELGIA